MIKRASYVRPLDKRIRWELTQVLVSSWGISCKRRWVERVSTSEWAEYLQKTFLVLLKQAYCLSYLSLLLLFHVFRHVPEGFTGFIIFNFRLICKDWCRRWCRSRIEVSTQDKRQNCVLWLPEPVVTFHNEITRFLKEAMRLRIPNRLVHKVDMATADYEVLPGFDVLEQGKYHFISFSWERRVVIDMFQVKIV